MNSFKKAALASSVIGLIGITNDAAATALTDSTPVIIGCTVPSNTTAAATVYSVDAYDSNSAALTGFPGWLKTGASCTRAVNFMVNNNGSSLVSVSNQVANGGYTLQSFVFGTTTGTNILANTTQAVSMIGCAAPASGTAGATIYSVDTQNSAGSTANPGITLTALSGNPCSAGLAQTGGTAGAIPTKAILNVRTADGTYSLQQYVVQ